jgi:hypothetical protein
MLIVGPILDDENEPIQIINVKLLLSQINDNNSNTKDSFYFNLWTHDAKELTNQDKKYWEIISHDLPTKQKVFNLCWSQGNCWNSCNSFFNVEIITSSFNVTCPKNKSSSSTTFSFDDALTRFKWRNTCNKKHITCVVLCHAIWLASWSPKKSHIIFMFLKQGLIMIISILWALVGL